jgi:flagellar basal-body rod protein FlgF
MQSGYYSATGGMVAQFSKLENTTNNLANMNSAGFKRDEMIFGDYLRLAQDKHNDLPLENHTKDSAGFYHRATTRVPQVTDQFSDFSLGAMKQTFNPLDLAIGGDKELFFVVETPEGNMLTRNGSFTTDGEGNMVTKDGFPVLDTNLNPINIDLSKEVVFDKNGNYTNGTQDGSLLIVRPENLRTLEKEGNGLFSIGDQNELVSEQDGLAIQQGFLETSNVNAVVEMSHLIEANRMVSMYQKVMDTQMNDLNRDAIEKLGNSRG